VELNLSGNSLYIYSDGVTEGHIAEGKELGLNGLMQMITELSDQPPQERLAAIVNRFDIHHLRDDVTLLLLEERHEQL
jgi:sigma-B regulation protein RsbU (phosphoserine phosphatase)